MKNPTLHDTPNLNCSPLAGKRPVSQTFKLARILWHLIKHKQAYDPAVWAAEEKLRHKKIKRLRQNAAALGFKLLSTS